MNNSPGTPTGTGRSRASRTCSPVFASGRPSDTVPAVSVSTRCMDDHTVVSVGPYMLSRAGTCSRSFEARLPGSASPPTSICRSPPSACNARGSSTSARAYDGVHWKWVTAWRSSRSANAAGSRPVGASTTWKPRVQAQSSSSTEMSKEMLVIASHVPGHGETCASIARKKFITVRCGTPTPLGRPVEPDV
ncbi:hypothetical protein COEX109129_42040 [Corallococcus exiguus]